MKPGITTTIHNRFDVYRTNVRTGETEQIAYAENIVLNSIWTRLVNRQTYFANIHYGTGTGTLAASRTSLFTHLGTRAAADDTLNKTIPTASWRRKIVLNPEDNVGAVLTEIGIAFDAGAKSLMTHAMLKDMNGNPVAITKTAVDLLTIYATVYITFLTTDANLQICGLPNNNPLMNYLVGGASIGNCYFYTGEEARVLENYLAAPLSAPVLGSTAAITWTADVANKKMTTSTPRFAVNTSNGHINEIAFGCSQVAPIFRIRIPSTGIYTGLALTNVPVGSGDGTTKGFKLPSRNVNSSTIVVKVDGVTVSNYIKRSRRSFITDYSRPVPPGYERTRNAISGDGKRVAYVYVTCANRIPSIYDVGEGDDVALANPPIGKIGNAVSCDFSDDGNVFAFCYVNSPYFTAYDFVNSVWVKRADPAVLPIGAPGGVALSADGTVLAVAHATTPFVSVYDWTASAWVKRADPAVLPGESGIGVALSADGTVLAVAHVNSPYLSTYVWSTGAWTKRTDPTDLPAGTCKETAISLSSDGSVLAMAFEASPYFISYDWSGSAWVKRGGLATPAYINNCKLSGDGAVLVCGQQSEIPYVYMYEYIDGAWVKSVEVATQYEGASLSQFSTINRNGDRILSHKAGDYGDPLESYIRTVQQNVTEIIFDSAPATGAIITADYTVDGIHKTKQRVIDLNASITFGEPT